MAEHSPSIERARHARPETSAWIVLVIFFLIFCAIVAGACVAAWRYYTNAMVPVGGTIVRVHAPAGVTYQPKGSAQTITPQTPCRAAPLTEVCQLLGEDERVQAVPEAGYGPVASIILPDGTRIADMYAHPTGADLTLESYQMSRWTKQRLALEFRQTAGYMRYDIPDKSGQPYAEVTYKVVIADGVSAMLSPGGSYSVDVPHYNKEHPQALAPSGRPVLAEVAVRTGSVELQGPSGSVIVHPGEKVQVDVDKGVSEALPARWELIHNGGLSQCKSDADLDGCGEWQLYREKFDQTLTKVEENGKFKVYRGCRPETPVFCTEDETTNIGQFHREGEQQKSYVRGIAQTLDLDISEYRELRFSMWARVIRQTVPRAGIANIECPVTIKFVFKQSSPSDDPEQRYICFYQDDTQQQIPPQGEFSYQATTGSSWYLLRYDLRDSGLLPKARYLQRIVIYANGHDYISEIADISLSAAQQR